MPISHPLSLGTLKVLQFFLSNPNSIDTPRGISAWTNLSYAETAKILEDLERHGILKAFRTSSTAAYSLTENKKTLSALQQLIKKHTT